MSYSGEIRFFAGNVPPAGWAFCHGQTAQIDAARQLHAAIGTRFGGDGRTTFRLPDLRSRVPVHRSERIGVGTVGGAESVALADAEIPRHTHGLPIATSVGKAGQSSSRALLVTDGGGSGVDVRLGAMTSNGLGTTHPNMQPYLALNAIIALSDEADGPFIGEVRVLAGAAAPDGWARCDGQGLAIDEFGDLYSVIGTTFGGDGRKAFALPDLRGRVAIAAGRGPELTTRWLAESGGEMTVALREDQVPTHEHDASIRVATAPGTRSPMASSAGVAISAIGAASQHAVPVVTERIGGSDGHSNLQPYMALTYIIACRGRLPEPD